MGAQRHPRRRDLRLDRRTGRQGGGAARRCPGRARGRHPARGQEGTRLAPPRPADRLRRRQLRRDRQPGSAGRQVRRAAPGAGRCGSAASRERPPRHDPGLVRRRDGEDRRHRRFDPGVHGRGGGVGGVGGAGGAGGAGGGISALIASIQATSEELRALIAENRSSLDGTVRELRALQRDAGRAASAPHRADRPDAEAGGQRRGGEPHQL